MSGHSGRKQASARDAMWIEPRRYFGSEGPRIPLRIFLASRVELPRPSTTVWWQRSFCPTSSNVTVASGQCGCAARIMAKGTQTVPSQHSAPDPGMALGLESGNCPQASPEGCRNEPNHKEAAPSERMPGDRTGTAVSEMRRPVSFRTFGCSDEGGCLST
jgi:hypothetical protein